MTLKPCPFCGATEDDEVYDEDDRLGVAVSAATGLFHVLCNSECSASGPLETSEEAATKAWNERKVSVTP